MTRAKDPVTGLTAQQEQAARFFALDGLLQHDAYLQAYPSSQHWNINSVYSVASELFHHPEMVLRVQQLKASLQAEAVTTAASLVKELLTVGNVKVPADQVRAADKVAALDKVAKILGLYKDQDAGRPAQVAITQVTVILDRGDQPARVVEVVPGPPEGSEAPRTEP